MTTAIDLAWDEGTTDGDPGRGRVRVNAIRIRDATHLLINADDRHGAALREIVPQFKMGDVLAVDRVGSEGQIIAWVLGQTMHRGTYYAVPVKIRSIAGAFASYDLVTLHRLEELSLTTEAPAPQASLVMRTLAITSTPTEPAQIDPEPVTPPIPFPSLPGTALATLKQQALDEMADPAPFLAKIATIEAYLEEEVAVEFAIRAQNDMIDQATRDYARAYIAEEAAALGRSVDDHIRDLISARANRQERIMRERLTRLKT